MKNIETIIIKEFLKWEEYQDGWFKSNGHYIEKIEDFHPALDMRDSFYILEKLDFDWTIETERLEDGAIQYNCSISVDEGKIVESHPVDTIYIGTAGTIPLAICKAIIEMKKPDSFYRKMINKIKRR